MAWSGQFHAAEAFRLGDPAEAANGFGKCPCCRPQIMVHPRDPQNQGAHQRAKQPLRSGSSPRASHGGLHVLNSRSCANPIAINDLCQFAKPVLAFFVSDARKKSHQAWRPRSGVFSRCRWRTLTRRHPAILLGSRTGKRPIPHDFRCGLEI